MIPADRWIDRHVARRMLSISTMKLVSKPAKKGIALIRDKDPALSPAA